MPFCAVSLGTAPVFSDSEGNPITEAVRSVVENTAAGENVGAPVTAMDADNDTLTYSLGGTDMASFDIDPSTGQIMVGAGTMLDYETKASYMVTVTATDPDSASDMITVTITVTNVGHDDAYDANDDGVIGPIEVLNAVEDYFNDVSGIDSERILDIVELYFSS